MATTLGLSLGLGGCAALNPQLDPPDIAALEQVADRAEREGLYTENSIYRHYEPQGVRYTKGNHPGSTKRSWQSLDAILRSDRNSSEALPTKQLRRARIFTALTLISSMVMIAGASASAREGLDFKNVGGAGALLLGGGIATVGFAIGGGVSYNQARKGYDKAVDVYNDSLGMRLGVLTPGGDYRPPSDVVVDEEGFVVLSDDEGPKRIVYLPEGPRPAPSPTADELRPASLTPADIEAGLADAKMAAVRECSSLANGREVVADVTVDGPSGAVVQVIADNDPAGACVASQLFSARFPAIGARQQAFSITLRF
jgi:catechol 2,3-dioxygenase-like lactoylglutathione lyase family enzyme